MIAKRMESSDAIPIRTEVVVLGGGVAGLAAAGVLGKGAMVLERDRRPGGVARTERFGEYWFDRVLHLLHFSDPAMESRVLQLLGAELVSSHPVAWVECAAGRSRYPLQMHLHGLDPETVINCLADLAETLGQPAGKAAADYEGHLRATFGRGLCELFFLPYNRKFWKRPLQELTAAGLQWNLPRPDLRGVLRGAMTHAPFRPYNHQAYYPRPPAGAAPRGIERLARALASRATEIRTRHTVTEIDLEQQCVTATHPQGSTRFHFARGCIATLPLPHTILLCRQSPEALRHACRQLPCNRVQSVFLCVRGPRPTVCGHWCYYTDESLAFNRLVYPHQFDAAMAPADGWGLMAEITEPAENPPPATAALLRRIRRDLQRIGALPADAEIVRAEVLTVDPAYVVFTPESQATVQRCLAFLRSHRIHPLGRYGRWEYSSMEQVIRDAWDCGRELGGTHEPWAMDHS